MKERGPCIVLTQVGFGSKEDETWNDFGSMSRILNANLIFNGRFVQVQNLLFIYWYIHSITTNNRQMSANKDNSLSPVHRRSDEKVVDIVANLVDRANN